ncbi:ABC transporter permease [Brevibacterium sp.]|uniref:ABC transporter permease n=1 Tax=Brevibacterium sp. TaxID=1701 RepID=UPI00281233CD|nr:ABC transporter permease [Brevibacterium sp.]
MSPDVSLRTPVAPIAPGPAAPGSPPTIDREQNKQRSRQIRGATTARRLLRILILAAAAALAVLLVAPVLYMVGLSFTTGQSFGVDHYVTFFTSQYYIVGVALNSVAMAAAGVLVAAVFAIPLAYVIARVGSAGVRRALTVALFVPLWINSVILMLGWYIIVGANGIVNQTLLMIGLIEEPLRILSTPTAVVIGLAQLAIPYIAMPLVGVFAAVPRSAEEAAHVCGASPARVFFRITLPLSAQGLFVGILLSFTLSIGALAVPNILGGGKVRMFSVAAYSELTTGNFGLASVIALVLLLTTVLCLSPILLLNRRTNQHKEH